MTFREQKQYEKDHMNKSRFIINNTIAPVYAGIFIVIFTVVSIMLIVDQKKYIRFFFIVGMILLFFVISVVFLVISYVFSRKEFKIECAKYNFDTSRIKDYDDYTFIATSNDCVVLFRDGLQYGNTCFEYRDFDIVLDTSNKLILINIYVRFILKADTDRPWFQLALTDELLYVIGKFNIILNNREELDYIMSNKEKAFKQIFSYGYIRKMK